MIRLLCCVHQHIDSATLEQLVKSAQPARQVYLFLCYYYFLFHFSLTCLIHVSLIFITDNADAYQSRMVIVMMVVYINAVRSIVHYNV